MVGYGRNAINARLLRWILILTLNNNSVMKPIEFKEANKVLNKPESMTDEECRNLSVYTNGKQCVSCWKVPFWKRVKMLFHGKVWLGVLSGQTQPPVWVDVDNTVFTKQYES